jgi:hypothetical protein
MKQGSMVFLFIISLLLPIASSSGSFTSEPVEVGIEHVFAKTNALVFKRKFVEPFLCNIITVAEYAKNYIPALPVQYQFNTKDHPHDHIKFRKILI